MLQIIDKVVDKINITLLVAISLSLGLAPFFPEPHVYEKLQMLFDGALSRPIDMFDLLLHGLPWILLMFKLRLMLANYLKDKR